MKFHIELPFLRKLINNEKEPFCRIPQPVFDQVIFRTNISNEKQSLIFYTFREWF